MSLREKLDARRAGAKDRFSLAQLAVMRHATGDLHGSGILGHALKTGDPAPQWELPDEHGNTVHSRDLLKDGPLVLTFFRGVW